MTSGFLRNSLFGGLAFRVLLFLSLALLPIGLIAFLQTQEIAEQSQSTAELSLIAITEQVSKTERNLLQEAVGAGRALSSVVKLVRDDPDQCSSFLANYRQQSASFRIVGFIEANGKMQCSSTGQTYNLANSEVFITAMEVQEPTVTSVARGAISRQSVVVVTVPVFESNTIIGVVFISIDREALQNTEDLESDTKPLTVITFNRRGTIVTSEMDETLTNVELPGSYQLEQLTGSERQVFTGRNSEGAERVYVVIPMLQETLFAMSVWPRDTPLLETDFSGRVSSLLPIVMWLASLIVAFWALNRLAITHIRKLGNQMRHFALNRTLPRKSLGAHVPVEIIAMEQSFQGMANSILQDEARQEDSIREKNILLKEVHHRVKNNLQLISSIMNMQIRQSKNPENKVVLQRLQDRILSLATVHKSLYQDNEMTNVDASILLREIVSRSLSVGLAPNAGIDIVEDYDSILVGPDDAAPLSLLVSETVTNALKYTDADAAGLKQITVSLKYEGEEKAMLRVANTLGPVVPEGGTGLGSKLILAFSSQLNGTLNIEQAEGAYSLELLFPIAKAGKQVYDY